MAREQTPLWREWLLRLSDDDIADLAAYYTTQATSGGAVDADLVARGEQLFRFGDSCKRCECLHSLSWSNWSWCCFRRISFAEGSMGWVYGNSVKSLPRGFACECHDERSCSEPV